ncbi:helix-turn-helix domain-containing protein [Saliterribacillus persicus]|uniref:DNA-binding XRE family transcriptional regulator n=1 Tax=Saliterribacillus persicus TaxID=930114 RepID=A0A368X4S1_9BACI|nr:helix-turn-helix transcriptional regulator [Saliterribacillus persicus]RCW63022.1 DNA-binding XRE family transcriptional regulator [Saliterribacillus persicus]
MGNNIWGKRIKAYRKLKGYTQVGFAKEVGLSVSILGELERGNRVPTLELLQKIAKTLDVSLDELDPHQES